MANEIKLPEFSELVGVLLSRADYCARKKGNEALEKYGITVYQAASLLYISRNQEQRSVNQRAIERYTGLSNPGVSKLISSLVDKGYIEKCRSSTDARNFSLRTTDAGSRIIEDVKYELAMTDRNICSSLTQSEIEILVSLLKKIHY